MNMKKTKMYKRIHPCAICGEYITTTYSKTLKKWVLVCDCGEDSSFDKLNKNMWVVLK